MSTGIVLLAIGPREYARFALNMAVSIRYFSGDVPIQLIHDGDLEEYQGAEGIFDVITPIDETDCRLNGNLFPGLAKLSLYKYLAFDHNLYLDVDGVCIKDVRPLLETKRKYFESEVQGWGELSTESYGIKMQWANGPVIAEHYGLPLTSKLPFINSSAQFITKGKKSEKLFSQARENILNPCELATGWGKKLPHRQPDELYMNTALVQLKHDPTCEDKLIYFKLRNEGPVDPLEKIQRDYSFLGVFGSLGTNKRQIYSLYDNIMINAMRKVLGSMHVFKVHNLMTRKFMIHEPAKLLLR